jgi:hypothetical protein
MNFKQMQLYINILQIQREHWFNYFGMPCEEIWNAYGRISNLKPADAQMLGVQDNPIINLKIDGLNSLLEKNILTWNKKIGLDMQSPLSIHNIIGCKTFESVKSVKKVVRYEKSCLNKQPF